MADVVRNEGGEPTMGQSPFAIARGQSFERRLFENGAERMAAALHKAGVIPGEAAAFRDFRTRMSGGSLRDQDEARHQTAGWLASLRGPIEQPVIAAGATIVIPGGIMLPEAMLVLDVLVAQAKGDQRVLTVGEIKTYPDRAGYTDAAELSTTRAQAGVYVHGLDLVLEELGLAGALRVSRLGFLVLTRPGYNVPAVRANEDLEYQARRAERGFKRLRRVAALDVPPPPDTQPERLAAVSEASIGYSEACVSFCDRAPACQLAALRAGTPALLGQDMVRFLGDIDLHRAVELLGGAEATTAAEQDLVRRFREADLTTPQ